MKITKLVILFNYQKILLGICIAVFLLIASTQTNSTIFSPLLKIVSVLILINIMASILASCILYDKSDLYTLNNLRGILDFEKINLSYSKKKKKRQIITDRIEPETTVIIKSKIYKSSGEKYNTQFLRILKNGQKYYHHSTDEYTLY